MTPAMSVAEIDQHLTELWADYQTWLAAGAPATGSDATKTLALIDELLDLRHYTTTQLAAIGT